MKGEYISIETAKIMSDMERDNNELYERIFDLEDKKYELQDRIESILDYLVKSHITVEEMEGVQKIAYE